MQNKKIKNYFLVFDRLSLSHAYTYLQVSRPFPLTNKTKEEGKKNIDSLINRWSMAIYKPLEIFQWL